MFWIYFFIFALQLATASEVEVFPKSLYPCRTSQSCTRYLRCVASRTIKWHYPNSKVITSTHTTTKTLQVDGKVLTIKLNPPEESDAGLYTCSLASDSTKNTSVLLKVIVDPYFIYGSSQLFENKTALRYHDIFLNCSVYPASTKVAWEFGPNHFPLNTNNENKYTQNSSGLTIYNVTSDDAGLYVCVIGNVNPLEAFISLTVTWAPQLLSQQNETLIVNVSDEVTLNCSASASPDPMYSWSFPGLCSSCPQHHNKRIMTFTANYTVTGRHVCVAENQYGNDSKDFIIHVNSKPMMNAERQLIMIGNDGDQSDNIMLTCGVQYAYPTPNIIWNITTPFNAMHHNSNSNSNYRIHTNGSIEIYHRFLTEEEHIIASCSATNTHGSSITEFHLWKHSVFIKKQTFTLVIKNITNCHQLKKDTNGLLTELKTSLRKWFASSCQCDGHNNLYSPHLTCLDNHTGNITSTVHHDVSSTAQQLIDLVTADLQMRDTPVVHLTHGWIMYLSTNLTTVSPTPTSHVNGGIDYGSRSLNSFDNNDNDGDDIAPLTLTIMIVVGSISFCVILLLITFIIVILVYIKQKRQSSKADATNTADGKVKVADDSIKEETHIYDDINQVSIKHCKRTNDKSEKLQDEVIFDITDAHTQPPAYRTANVSTCDSSNFSSARPNDYYIEDEEMGSIKAKIGQRENNLNTWQNNQTYNKLIHCSNQ